MTDSVRTYAEVTVYKASSVAQVRLLIVFLHFSTTRRTLYHITFYLYSLKSVTMGFWDNNEDNYQRVYENDRFEEHKASLGHEVLAGGAAFAGFKGTIDDRPSG